MNGPILNAIDYGVAQHGGECDLAAIAAVGFLAEWVAEAERDVLPGWATKEAALLKRESLLYALDNIGEIIQKCSKRWQRSQACLETRKPAARAAGS